MPKAQDDLYDAANTVEGLMAAVELCSDAIEGISDPDLARKALPSLCEVLNERIRALAAGIDKLDASGVRRP